MPDIRYVCLSDVHFGAVTSLLTNLEIASDIIDASQPSPVMSRLVKGLRDLIGQNEDKTRKPTLVLNGDILELALAEDHDAAMTFEQFINLIMPQGDELFGEIFFIPGNHDHHLWETARESQYIDYISEKPWGDKLPSPWHTTYMFTNPVRSFFLTRLIQRRPNLKNLTIQTAYPNLGLLSDDRKRAVVFHHGHFIEPMYILMSTLKTMIFPDSKIPHEIWNLEAENFAWIDYFWSTMGRSGDAGRSVGRVYERLRHEVQLKELLANLANSLAKRYGLSGWADRIEAKALELAFNALADRISGLERNKPAQVLSEDAEKGLWTFVEKTLPHQMTDEKVAVPALERFTFIFGHTHKPFQENMNFRPFANWAKVYNSGGWVVDTVDRQPLHGGAVILVDENLEAISLRMYNESADPEEYAVTLGEATYPGDPPSLFHERIMKLVAKKPDLWKDFSQAVARAVSVRAQNLRTRINSPL